MIPRTLPAAVSTTGPEESLEDGAAQVRATALLKSALVTNERRLSVVGICGATTACATLYRSKDRLTEEADGAPRQADTKPQAQRDSGRDFSADGSYLVFRGDGAVIDCELEKKRREQEQHFHPIEQVNTAHKEALELAGEAVSRWFAIGEFLDKQNTARQYKRGKEGWLAWQKNNCAFSHQQADRYMRLHRNKEKLLTMSNFHEVSQLQMLKLCKNTSKKGAAKKVNGEKAASANPKTAKEKIAMLIEAEPDLFDKVAIVRQSPELGKEVVAGTKTLAQAVKQAKAEQKTLPLDTGQPPPAPSKTQPAAKTLEVITSPAERHTISDPLPTWQVVSRERSKNQQVVVCTKCWTWTIGSVWGGEIMKTGGLQWHFECECKDSDREAKTEKIEQSKTTKKPTATKKV